MRQNSTNFSWPYPATDCFHSPTPATLFRILNCSLSVSGLCTLHTRLAGDIYLRVLNVFLAVISPPAGQIAGIVAGTTD